MESLVASKWPQRPNLTSNLKATAFVCYVEMAFFHPKVDIQPFFKICKKDNY